MKKEIIKGVFPILLFYIMRTIDSFVTLDAFVGPSKEAAQVVEFFLYGIIGLMVSNSFYPTIQKIAINNRKIAKTLFQALNYPVDYFWNSIILISLTATNVNPTIQTPIFTLIIITLSSFLQTPVRRIIGMRYKDLRQEAYQDGAIRDISLFIIVFITLLIFIIR